MTDTPERPLILVVDDSRTKRIYFVKLLAHLEAQIVEADSGARALELIAERSFALVVMDVNMPGIDGFEAAQRITDNPRTRGTPIMFVTATAMEESHRFRAYGSGAVDFMIEPVDPVVFVSKVRVFLELYRVRQELSLRNTQLEAEVAERKRLEELARHQAGHDPLTGLPNRLLFMDQLDMALARASRRSSSCALLYVDIDGFKAVNDAHGHPAGDALLKAIAARLREALRGEDTVARIGGDEFAVIMNEPQDAEQALRKGRELCASLARAFPLALSSGEQPILATVGASIGAALYPEHGRERDALVRIADAAMYRAKQAGKNQCLLAS